MLEADISERMKQHRHGLSLAVKYAIEVLEHLKSEGQLPDVVPVNGGDLNTEVFLDFLRAAHELHACEYERNREGKIVEAGVS